ncbi:MAG: aminotransferase class V-fold PLP-dependent enzyme [Desulfarculus sp.]|jgi:cysteine desulfurase family protein|nr:MAG: aminotransferase class V-fold PLP-dependent enzyme [Desulfarculus sp.]
MIYLDNAATSFPKPAGPLQRALEAYLKGGASPGRGGYDLAVEAEYKVEQVRRDLCRFFGGAEGYRVCFTYNATDALNILIQGLAQAGGRVVSSRLEHNSVLRPLHHLHRAGVIELDLVPCNGQGFLEPQALARALRPRTSFAILTHASNVLGTIQPLPELAALCRDRGVPLLVDASQSAGLTPIHMHAWGLAGLAFTGHKSLLGPTGIGGLVLSPQVDPRPTRFGGTGMDSSSLLHTLEYPYRLEAGTINLLGVLALGECLDYLATPEHQQALGREVRLWSRLRQGLADMPGVELYAAQDEQDHLPLLSCNLHGLPAGDAADILDGDFGIAVRSGLHCAPLVHQDLGTAASGALRFSLGPFNTDEHIQAALEAMSLLAQKAAKPIN